QRGRHRRRGDGLPRHGARDGHGLSSRRGRAGVDALLHGREPAPHACPQRVRLPPGLRLRRRHQHRPRARPPHALGHAGARLGGRDPQHLDRAGGGPAGARREVPPRAQGALTARHHPERTRDMKYLLLIYENESASAGLSEAEQGKIFEEYMVYTKDIRKTGHYIGGEALQPVASATTVRVKGGKTLTTDGPFAETREQLGGYYLVEAKDLDEATSLAARIPAARTGSIEVRPIWPTPPPQ